MHILEVEDFTGHLYVLSIDLQARTVNNLVVNAELTALIGKHEDTNASTAVVEALRETGVQAALVKNR